MFWKEAPKPMIVLAPMDGYTDQAFRLLVRHIEPRSIVFTEFLSADGICYGARPILQALELRPEESPIVVQMFGKDPDIFAKAALYVEAKGATAIDVNMGCPAKKVVNSMHGSALMREVDLACRIIEKMKQTVKVPISVKTRLGWEDDSKLISFVQRLVDAGLDHVSIHGRTYNQAFRGEAVWDAIYELKKAVPITVVGNGDVVDGASARAKLGNLDGVMVGRATFGNPWIMKEVAHALLDNKEWRSATLTFAEKIPTIRTHMELLWNTKGKRGMLEARKHLAAYVKGVHGASTYRSQLVTVEHPDEVYRILDEIMKAQ